MSALLLLLPPASSRLPQITATIGLVTYASARRKLTPAGVLAGVLVAGVHALHPWPAFFWLLVVFFGVGMAVTKIGHAHKAHLTQSATGGTGGEGPRSAAQVFANSGFACALVAAHAHLLLLHSDTNTSTKNNGTNPSAAVVLQSLLPIGIVAQYAAVAADTFGSELGILAPAPPFLITAPWRRVPRGTNGGVTLAGLGAGVVGAAALALTAGVALRVAEPRVVLGWKAAGLLVAAGVVGSLVDSLLGACVQITVTDRTTGRVVEGPGGARVKVSPVGAGGSRVAVGRDLLTNNGVNFVMAACASVLAMGVAFELGIRVGE